MRFSISYITIRMDESLIIRLNSANRPADFMPHTGKQYVVQITQI